MGGDTAGSCELRPYNLSIQARAETQATVEYCCGTHAMKTLTYRHLQKKRGRRIARLKDHRIETSKGHRIGRSIIRRIGTSTAHRIAKWTFPHIGMSTCHRIVDMPPYWEVDIPPYWEVDKPPPCDVLRLRGQVLKFGMSGLAIFPSSVRDATPNIASDVPSCSARIGPGRSIR
jgi:hypothetical protein